MAKNKIDIIIDGDTTGLQKALNKGQASVDDFGKKVGGTLGDASGKVSGGLKMMSGGLTGMISIAGIAATSFAALAIKLNDNVRELNALSKQSGMTVTEIQQLDKAFRQTGLGMEKLLDINQDVKDKMGEGFATGGGEFATTIKEMNGNLNEYTQYLNKPDGGIQATLHLMEAMTRAGKSSSEITFALEAIGSDASRLYSRYQELGSAAVVLNDIHEQTTTVTERTAAAFLLFDQNLNSASTTGQAFIYDFITPSIEELNDLYSLLNKDWSGSDFMQMLYRGSDNFLLGGKGIIPDSLKKLLGKDSLDSAYISGSTENDFVKASQAGYEANKAKFIKPKNTDAPTRAGWVDPKAAEKAAEAAQKKADAAAAKAKAAQEKAAREREQAERQLEVALSQIAEDGNQIRLQQFDRQQKTLIKTIEDTAKKVGKSTEEIQGMIEKARSAGAKARVELLDSMIGKSDPNQDLKDQNSIAGSLNTNQKSFLADQQNQRINGDNPFVYDNTQQKLDDNSAREQEELSLNETLLSGTEDFEKRKAEIKAKYAAMALELEQQNVQSQMSIMGQAAGDLGSMMAGVFGQSSIAAKSAFAIQRGIQMAQIMMNIQVALSQAMATPFPASLAAYAKVAGMGASLISTAKGIQGQAHSGIEEVPGSLGKDSTWVLQAGERVVSRNQNSQLQQFLDNQDSRSGGTGDIVVNAPFYNMGGGNDAQFQEMAKRNGQAINQAIRDTQKRSS